MHNMMRPLLGLLGPAPDPGRLGLSDWDMVVRQARRADVLARVGALAKMYGVWDAIAPAPRQHIASALALATRQQRELHFEVGHIEKALRSVGVPTVLLKGGGLRPRGFECVVGAYGV